ncbi:MAG: MauE/DoxX family redox-associated membrane protein [Acidimicrobiales bacterium]
MIATAGPAAAVGPLLVGAVILVVAGAAKLLHPRETAVALRLSGLPASSLAVRLGALAEIGVAAGAIFTGAPVLCIAVGLSYMAFATFVAVALVRGLPLSSCGCLGEPDSPPTAAHVGLDLVFAAGAFWAAANGLEFPLGSLVHRPVLGVGLALAVGVASWLSILSLTTLGQLGAESRRAAFALLGHSASRQVTP